MSKENYQYGPRIIERRCERYEHCGWIIIWFYVEFGNGEHISAQKNIRKSSWFTGVREWAARRKFLTLTPTQLDGIRQRMFAQSLAESQSAN